MFFSSPTLIIYINLIREFNLVNFFVPVAQRPPAGIRSASWDYLLARFHTRVKFPSLRIRQQLTRPPEALIN